MFQSLSDRLSGVLDKLTRRGALTESDVSEAMREVRRALLEADVALDVVKGFVDRVKAKAVGQEVLKSVTPGQMVVKIVHDELVAVLGSDAETLSLAAIPPIAILMVGLQGSGKTTSTAKIAYRLTNRDKKKVLMASLDTRRPAAMEQLRVLGEQTGVTTLPIVAGQTPVQIARRAHDAAKLGGYDVVLLDTAGRVTVDDELMREVAEVKRTTSPHEVLLVADSLTGQDAVNTATAFDSQVGITGIVLTRADGDGRGGAALSMRAVTGKPIKLIGTGEKWDALEDFDPSRIAGRILGMGDIVGLVEKAAQTIDAQKAQAIAERMRKGAFDLEDLAEQLKQMEKLGGMGGLMGLMPGMGKIKQQMADANLDDKILRRQLAIIQSMTPHERRNPKVLNAKRKKRVAGGSGTSPADINKLLKMHQQMAAMMKKLGGRGGMLGKMGGMFGMGGGGAAGAQPSAEEMAKMQEELAALDPKALEQLPPELREAVLQGGAAGPAAGNPAGAGAPSLPAGLPGGLPGLGAGMPGMPGMPGLGGLGGGFPGMGGGRNLARMPSQKAGKRKKKKR
ncbi:MAG: signal recognition particle protein [Hyphomicrobiaceae bacterium]|nr:signal recognition particle protein [Hyphomicrobiaceae bacterium]MCC0009379.1 signal recognition particle protein [Hyphomicrobiaceae bacterium]